MSEKCIKLPFMGDPWLDWGAANFTQLVKGVTNLNVVTTDNGWELTISLEDLKKIEQEVLRLSCKAQSRIAVSKTDYKPTAQNTYWWDSKSRLADSNPPTETSGKFTTISELYDKDNNSYQKLLSNCIDVYRVHVTQISVYEERLNSEKDKEQKDIIKEDIKRLNNKLKNENTNIEAFSFNVLAYEISKIKEMSYDGEPKRFNRDKFLNELENRTSKDFADLYKKNINTKYDEIKNKTKTYDEYLEEWNLGEPLNKFFYAFGDLKSKVNIANDKASEINSDLIPFVTGISKGSNCVSGFSTKAVSKLNNYERLRALCSNIYLGNYASGRDMKIYFFPVADTAVHLGIVLRNWKGILGEAGNEGAVFKELKEWKVKKPNEIEFVIMFEIFCYIKNYSSKIESQLWKNHVSLCFIREDKVDREYRVFHRFSDFMRLMDSIIDGNRITIEKFRKFIKSLYSRVSASDNNDWLWREEICRRFLSFQDIGIPFINLTRQNLWIKGKNTGKPRYFPDAEIIIPSYYKALNQI